MSNSELENSLGVLRLLSEALTAPRSLDEGLDYITRMTCQLMEAGQAVFLFRDEERKELIVRSVVGIQSKNINQGNTLFVPERLKNILWRLRNIHQINWVDSGIEDIGFPIIVAPICVKGMRVGLLATGAAKDPSPRPFSPVRQDIFSLIASFASLVIENAKVYDLLKQHFAVNSPELKKLSQQEAKDRNPAEQFAINSINNPGKVVRILAQSFYNELKRAGFQQGHIASAASQLLECIVKNNQA